MEDYYSNISANYVRQNTRAADNNTINAYTTYNLRLGAEKEHAFKFMAGMNQVTSKWSSHQTERSGLIDQTNPQFHLAGGVYNGRWQPQLGRTIGLLWTCELCLCRPLFARSQRKTRRLVEVS